MPPLSELQAGVSRALLSGHGGPVAEAIEPDGLAPARRLMVYRNHYLITLTEALAATYPVVARLVGEACFGGLAHDFAVLSPPRSPCLFEYGAGFPRYLAAVPTLDHLPYLIDVARLEWAINAARHAPDAPRLLASELAALPDTSFAELVFTLHPSARLVTSPYPIDRIWRANQAEAHADVRVALDEGGVRLLVHRDGEDDPVWCPLTRAEQVFLATLGAAQPLGEAWTQAAEADAGFNGGRFLAALVGAGVFTDVRVPTIQDYEANP